MVILKNKSLFLLNAEEKVCFAENLLPHPPPHKSNGRSLRWRTQRRVLRVSVKADFRSGTYLAVGGITRESDTKYS